LGVQLPQVEIVQGAELQASLLHLRGQGSDPVAHPGKRSLEQVVEVGQPCVTEQIVQQEIMDEPVNGAISECPERPGGERFQAATLDRLRSRVEGDVAAVRQEVFSFVILLTENVRSQVVGWANNPKMVGVRKNGVALVLWGVYHQSRASGLLEPAVPPWEQGVRAETAAGNPCRPLSFPRCVALGIEIL
jgi:hypothetical protein